MIAYFDCFSGASGDMILGALVDAGLSVDALRDRLQKLAVPSFDLAAEAVQRKGLAATQVTVTAPDERAHRHLPEILQLIEQADFGPRVTDAAGRIFQRLAEAEARVHGCAIEKVHFHEVGAVDAIVDIVGACLGLEMLDVDQVQCSAIPVGSGTVTCEHGVLPVPAPATTALLRNVPIAECSETGELLTPTGAAILTTLSERFGPPPTMVLRSAGQGAGRRLGQHRANLLRVLIGEAAGPRPSEDIVVLEASIDDQSPEVTAYAVDRLLGAGALDVYSQSIVMKKGRAGVLLTVLAEWDRVDALEACIFTETTTFGVRRQAVHRSVLDRDTVTVALPEGDVRIKIGRRGPDVVSAAPEFEDCRRLAEAGGRPLKRIMSEALAAWNARNG